MKRRDFRILIKETKTAIFLLRRERRFAEADQYKHKLKKLKEISKTWTGA